MTNIRYLGLIGLCAVSGFTVHAAQAQTFGNTNNGGDITVVGAPDTTNYGEEFTAPGGTLQSWSFATDGGTPGNLGFVIAAWNGTEAVGPALYQGTVMTNTGASGETYTWSGINLALAAGTQYIAYLTVAGVNDPTSNVPVQGSLDNGGLGGEFFYLNSDGADPLASPSQWYSYVIPDMTFSATFGNAIPEPSTVALLGAGLLGMGVLRRKRAA
jgi:hypothetical protein